MNIYVKDCPQLVGDFLGILPSLMYTEGKDAYVLIDALSENKNLYTLIPESYNIFPVEELPSKIDRTVTVDIAKAFELAAQKNLYMSQAFFPQFGFSIPVKAPHATLECGYVDFLKKNSFYCISPFARSLPKEQLWSKEKWEELAAMNPEQTFVVLGNSKYDERNYITGSNVIDFYNHPLKEVAYVLRQAKALISVITGTSHLAFHLGVKNVVLNNQNMTWGRNPDGIHVEDYILDLKVEKLNQIINEL